MYLEKGSSLATSHKYLQVAYELDGLLNFIKYLSNYYDELRAKLNKRKLVTKLSVRCKIVYSYRQAYLFGRRLN